ncbi:MAG: HNH endonuclease [Pleomorphochaeta sp.]
MEWIISANQEMYNHKKAFKEFEFIDWTQKAKYQVGDIVFIYSTKPVQKIMYETVVEKINMSYEEINDDKKFWINLEKYFDSLSGKFVRLRLLEYKDINFLRLENLIQNGLKKAPQGPIQIKSNQLSNYINSFFHNDNLLDSVDPLNNNLFEGHCIKIKVNRYERNAIARELCIEKYGYNCSICGMNFEESYGDVGKEFIHVHHRVPLNEISQEYSVNPEEDLIPVCPNCHAMLHRKTNGKFLTVDELKKNLTENRN